MTFVPHHAFVGAPDAEKLAIVLHGALGSGGNLRSLALKLGKQRPEYGFALVDLRHHGASQGAPAPNTLRACAEDLAALAGSLGREPDVMIGHSFGGKASLMFAQLYPGRVKQFWVLDSNPGPQAATPDHEILRVLAALSRTVTPAPERGAIVAQLTEQGLSSGIANWLATNLRREPGGFVWALDLDAIQALMGDYFAVDLWPVLESRPIESDFRVVVAEQSDRWAPENRARLQQAAHGRVHLDVVPNAGHWLHVDNPGFLLELMSRELY